MGWGPYNLLQTDGNAAPIGQGGATNVQVRKNQEIYKKSIKIKKGTVNTDFHSINLF